MGRAGTVERVRAASASTTRGDLTVGASGRDVNGAIALGAAALGPRASERERLAGP